MNLNRPAPTFTPIPGVTVLGIGHKARQGKDTVAAAILAAMPDAVRIGFADALYDYCREVYGMEEKDAPLLQRVGVTKRDKDPYFWIRQVYAVLDDTRPAFAVIPDVRFQNEMTFVRQLGGTCMKVSRVNQDGTPYIDPERPADHISENALNDAEWDYVIKGMSGETELIETEGVRIAQEIRQVVQGV